MHVSLAVIGVASAESTAIGDPLRARKNRGKTSGVVDWSVVSTVLWRGCGRLLNILEHVLLGF